MYVHFLTNQMYTIQEKNATRRREMTTQQKSLLIIDFK